MTQKTKRIVKYTLAVPQKILKVLFPHAAVLIDAATGIAEPCLELLPNSSDGTFLAQLLQRTSDAAATRIEDLYLSETNQPHSDQNTDFLQSTLLSAVQKSHLEINDLIDHDIEEDYIADRIFDAITSGELKGLSDSEQNLLLRAISLTALTLSAAIADSDVYVTKALKRVSKTVTETLAVTTETLTRTKNIEDLLQQRLLSYSNETTDEASGFESEYLSKFRARHSMVSIIGVDFASSLLFDVEDIHVTLSARAADSETSDSAMTATSFVADRDISCIIGAAGSGKTTLLQWIGSCAIWRQRLESRSLKKCVPFFLKVRELHGKSLPRLEDLAFTVGKMQTNKPDSFVRDIFASGRGILLVDGLDEVANDDVSRVLDWLSLEVLSSYKPALTVITSRPLDSVFDAMASLKVDVGVLNDMTPRQIRSLCNRWFVAVKSTDPAADSAFCDSSTGRILELRSERRHIRSLTRTPLFCSMLCALYYHRRGDLPGSATELYRAIVELLLDRRDNQRRIQVSSIQLSLSAKATVLEELAYNLAGKNNLAFDEKALGVSLGNHRVAGRSGISITEKHSGAANVSQFSAFLLNRATLIVEVAKKTYEFRHKSFLEYFAASHIAKNALDSTLYEHLELDTWRAIASFFVGMVGAGRSSKVVTAILDGLHSTARLETAARVALGLVIVSSCEAIEGGVADRIERELARFIPPSSERELELFSSIPEDLHGAICSRLDQAYFAGSIDLSTACKCLRRLASIEACEVFERILSAQAPNALTTKLVEEAWMSFPVDIFAPFLEAYTLRMGSEAALIISCDRERLEFCIAKCYNFIRGLTLSELVPEECLYDLKNLHNLETLEIGDASTLTNVRWLTTCDNLREITLSRAMAVTDLTGLDSAKSLSTVSISGLAKSLRSQVEKIKKRISMTVTYSVRTPIKPVLDSVVEPYESDLRFHGFTPDDVEGWLDQPALARPRARSALYLAKMKAHYGSLEAAQHALEMEAKKEMEVKVRALKRPKRKSLYHLRKSKKR